VTSHTNFHDDSVTFVKFSDMDSVVIGKPERHVRKASHLWQQATIRVHPIMVDQLLTRSNHNI